MNSTYKLTGNKEGDHYVHGMDWLSGELEEFELSNYRKYQYDLIAKHLGKNILEVGSGDRSFTNQILKNTSQFDRIIQLSHPSPCLNYTKTNINFPVTFHSI